MPTLTALNGENVSVSSEKFIVKFVYNCRHSDKKSKKSDAGSEKEKTKKSKKDKKDKKESM